MKSVYFGVFTLISVLIFAVTLGFIWTGSAGVSYKRVAMAGDMATEEVVGTIKQKHKTRSEDVEEMDLGLGDLRASGMAGGGADMGGGGDNTVVWINIPGFRGDYIEQAAAAFMKKLADEGASTAKMRPNFPCVTYHGHTTMATGTTASGHGIPSDVFRVNGTIVERPTDPSLLQAEPIWQTAARQGMPSLVHDWPLSQNQTGPNAATYFLKDFDPATTDQQRLDRLWDAWVAHTGEKKLRLLMCRLDDILKAGRENGPRAPETYAAVKKTDALLEAFTEKVKAAWSNLRAAKDGNLVFLITTDHGLAEVTKNINFAQLMGPKLMENLDVAAHDSVAQVYFKNLPEGAAEANLLKDQIDAELKKRIYFRTYKQEEFPSDWKYASPDGRVGDRVLVLKTGFAFTKKVKGEEPVIEPVDGEGFFGGYGFPVSDSIRMSGQIILWGYPQQVASGDLDEIDQTVFHSTVCKLLKIQPSEKASDKGLSVN